MIGQHPVWTEVRISIVNGQTHNIWDYMAFKYHLEMAFTQAVAIFHSTSVSARPLASLPLDCHRKRQANQASPHILSHWANVATGDEEHVAGLNRREIRRGDIERLEAAKI
jgi:hypothetical protein